MIARDKIGVKPLFIGVDNDNNYMFASEGKALVNTCNYVYPFKPSKYCEINLCEYNSF